jgi:hypothetical protein
MLLGQSRGLPWWGAVLLAFGFAVVGKLVDLQLGFTADKLFQGAYFIGCVGAICLVRRRNLFAPMVQPPLILAITVPGVTLLFGTPGGGSLRNQILTLGTPLINGFPTMAITTVITIAVGVFRIYSQRKPASAGKRAPIKAGQAKPAAGKASPTSTAAKRGTESARSRGTTPRGDAARAGKPAQDGTPGRREPSAGQPAKGRTAKDQAGRSRTAAPRGSASARQAEQPADRRASQGRPRRGDASRNEAAGGTTSRANAAANKARERARQIREDGPGAGEVPQRRRRAPAEDPEARRRRRQAD